MSFSRKIRIFCVRTYQYWLPFLSFYSIRVYARAYRIQSSYAPTTVHVVLTYDDVYARINIDYHFYHFYSIRVYARAYRIQSHSCMLSSHQNLRSTKTGNSIERRARAFPRSCHSLTAVNSPFTRFVLMNSCLSLFLKTMKPETMYIYKILKIVLIFSFYIDARNYEVKIYWV